MTFSAKKFLLTFSFILAIWQPGFSQDVKRELNIVEGNTVEIINKYGRVAVVAASTGASLTATSTKGISDPEIKISSGSGRTVMTVVSSDTKKRIDISLALPERTTLKIETVAGAVDVSGNFTSIEAKTDTGTISMDVPDEQLRYRLQWTESRPRYLADFEMAAVKERSAGRFEINGLREVEEKGSGGEGETGRKGEEAKRATEVAISEKNKLTDQPKAQDQKPNTVSTISPLHAGLFY